MPPALPFTYVVRKKTGTELWYFRHPTLTKAVRIPGRPGEPAFHREYSRLLCEAVEEKTASDQRCDNTSIRWLTERWQASDEWNRLKPSTKTSYERELSRLNARVGDLPFADMTMKHVDQLRAKVIAGVVADRQAAIAKRKTEDEAALAAGLPVSKRKPPKPTDGFRTGDLFTSVLAAMFAWAIYKEHVVANPADKMKKLQRKSLITKHEPWSEAQIAHFLREAPRSLRDGVIVGLHTGQRLGDCLLMTKARSIGGEVRVKQEKTGNLVDVPATGPLLELIRRRTAVNDPNDCDRLVIRDDGKRYLKRHFSEDLRKELDRLGFPTLSFHGLRYAAAGRLLEAGLTQMFVKEITGHASLQMALEYAEARLRKAQAAEAMEAAAAKIEQGNS